jgi:hypothetical protein
MTKNIAERDHDDPNDKDINGHDNKGDHGNQNEHGGYLHKFDIENYLNHTVDAKAIDHSPTNNGSMYSGTGNSPTGYHVSDNTTLGFELALKEHTRLTGPDYVHTGDADGTANVVGKDLTQVDPNNGKTYSNFNFDYVVVTGLNGATTSLADFTFKIEITQNGTNTHIFDLNPTTHIWVDEAHPLIGFGGDDFHPHEADANASTVAHVSENSQNLRFLTNAFGPLSTSTALGTTYDIQLEAFQGVHLVGVVHDHVTLAA